MPAQDAGYKVTFESCTLIDKFHKWKNVFWNLSADIIQVKAQAESLRMVLAELLGDQTVIRSINFKYLANTRLSETWWAPKFNPAASGSANDTDYPTTAVLTELVAASGRRTRIWLSGIEDRTVAGGGKLQVNDKEFSDKWKAFRAELVANNNTWVIRFHDPDQAPIAVQSFDPATGVLTLHAAHGMAADELASYDITGFLNPQINGRKKLKQTGTNTAKLDNWTSQPNLVVSRKDKCNVRKVLYDTAKIKEAVAVRSSSHDRGRPI